MKLPTRRDYDKTSPRTQGFWCYMYAEWPDSEIPKTCPYPEGTEEYKEFQLGETQAMLVAQDSEE